nr:translation initiation factor IF-2 subunit gamma [Methanopyrus sp. SNP6]
MPVDLRRVDDERFQQAEMNIGMVGHVDHGKTTLTKALSGVWTDTHSEETRRGISIRLGYADTVLTRCPECDTYSVEEKCPKCGAETEWLRRVSFVDSPGHETLMATMLSGAAIMDAAILVIAANEPCPQPQTREHLMALEIIGTEDVIVVQNKIDLVTSEEARGHYEQIVQFLEEETHLDPDKTPIIPVSAQHKANLDVLVEAMYEHFEPPEYDPNAPFRMYIARSFDVNKPGTRPSELKGGVIGGAIVQGEVEIGDEIEIRPGIRVERYGRTEWEPVYTEVVSLHANVTPVERARPGGLVGIGTKLDPTMTKADRLSGQVAGEPDTLPPVRHELLLEVELLERVVGTEEERKVEPIRTNEVLMLTVGTATTVGVVTSARDDEIEIKLKQPVCAEEGDMIAISRRIQRWRLIGHGVIKG